MNGIRYVFILKASIFSMIFMLTIAAQCYGQIYEATRVEDQRSIQYDTLDVKTVEGYGFGWKWKMRYLESIKKYDSDGFLIEVTFYERKGRWRRSKPTVTRIYNYNLDRTQVVEIWLDRAKRKADTTFISTQTFDSGGKLLSKFEKLVKQNEVRTIDYSYDDHGNCESIHRSERSSNSVVRFKNTYDSAGRIIRQVKTLRGGGKSQHARLYDNFGNVERDSISNGYRVEVFKYNLNGEIERKDYHLDSTQIGSNAFKLKRCVTGSEHYRYDVEGRLVSTKYDCETYMNKDILTSVLALEKKLEYDEFGLLTRIVTLFHSNYSKRPNKDGGSMFKYKKK
jgi:hypothetical protein